MGLFFLTLLVGVGLLPVVVQLRKLSAQLQAIANHVGNRDDSVHDVTHPVFSVRQLLRVRQGFATEYRRQLQRETELYESTDWRSRRESAGVSSQLRERLQAVCEAVVQCECTWKKYVWMVEGNLAVAAGRESRTAIVQGFHNLLARTSGSAQLTVTPNAEKVRRVEAILTNWIARLNGTTTEGLSIEMPDTAEEDFDVLNEEMQKSMAQMRG